ncbi:clumping factor B, partial [Biomphalaria glabrata]
METHPFPCPSPSSPDGHPATTRADHFMSTSLSTAIGDRTTTIFMEIKVLVKTKGCGGGDRTQQTVECEQDRDQILWES